MNEKWNVGMDMYTGEYTAPVAGLYYFSFRAVEGSLRWTSYENLAVCLQLQRSDYDSDVCVANGWAKKNTDTSLTVDTLQFLKKGWKVYVKLETGVMWESGNSFTGVLIKPEF